jgi:Kef-type K+ transport system membrane component KefB
VVGQLLVGILLGPAVLSLLHADHAVDFIAEIGVILLMFLAGMESDLALLKKFLKPALLVACLGVIFPLASFTGVTHVLENYSNEESIFIGIVFAATSVSITVEVLQEFKRLQTKEGATILGAAVADDILAVLLLSLFLTVFGVQDGESGHSFTLVQQLFMQAAFVVVLVLLMKFIVPKFVHLFDTLPMFATATISALVLCLGLANLAEYCGFSDVIGAFFAGVAVGRSNKEIVHRLEDSISIVGYTIFIPVFFASIGLSMTLNNFMKNFWILLMFTVLAVVTKLFGGMIAAKLSHFSWKSGYTIGSGMVSRGEMALIVAQIGFQAKLVDSSLYSDLVIVIILSTMIAPILLKHSFKLAGEVSE